MHFSNRKCGHIEVHQSENFDVILIGNTGLKGGTDPPSSSQKNSTRIKIQLPDNIVEPWL